MRCLYLIFAGSVGRFWVSRVVALSLLLFFLVLKLYFRSLTISLLVCNMYYDGSLVAASCNSLLLNEKRAIFLGPKKVQV